MLASRSRRPGITKLSKRFHLLLEQLENRCVPASGYGLVDLAWDVPGLARTSDPDLAGAWGMAASPTGPFWLTGSASGMSTLLDGRGQVVPLEVRIPASGAGRGKPAGIVFNPGSGFVVSSQEISAPGQFLFAGLDGTLSAWAPAVDPAHAVLVQQGPAGAAYTGLALATDPAGNGLLYAADFGLGTIDVFDQNYQPVIIPEAFQDSNLPAGYAPYNVQFVDGFLFVTYALKDPVSGYDLPGTGNGVVDIYSTQGQFVKRFAEGGALNAPWGIALAPSSFGPLGGSLLIGNNGDGQINAYEFGSGAFLGTLTDNQGQPLAIPNLWSLAFGNDHESGAADTLFFAASPGYRHGLFGAIQSPGRQGADTGGIGGFDPTFPGERRDYPLPPSTGPALQTDKESALPVVSLLPLATSALVLAPTLSPLSAGGGSRATSAAPAALALSPDRPATTALLASGTLFLFPGTPASAENADVAQNSPSLGRLLDLNPLEEASPPRLGRPAGETAQAAHGASLPAPPILTAGDRITRAPALASALPSTPATVPLRLVQTASALPAGPFPAAVAITPALTPPEPFDQHTSSPWVRLVKSVVPVIGFALMWHLFDRRRRRAGERRQAVPELTSRLP
jgi:uncharacterized protein (TIGR03118 family)